MGAGDGTRAQISASVSVWCRPAVSREHGDVMHMVSGRPCLVLGDPLAIISILESLPFSLLQLERCQPCHYRRGDWGERKGEGIGTVRATGHKMNIMGMWHMHIYIRNADPELPRPHSRQ